MRGCSTAWGGGDLPGADPDFRPGGLQGGGEHVLVLHLPPDADPFLIVAPVFALLGVLVPLAVYRSVSKATIVERLREVD